MSWWTLLSLGLVAGWYRDMHSVAIYFTGAIIARAVERAAESREAK